MNRKRKKLERPASASGFEAGPFLFHALRLPYGKGALTIPLFIPARPEIFGFAGERGLHMIAEKGKKVRVHYTGTLADGDIFDSSTGRDPLEFVVGAGQMIAGFDRGVEGMAVGEEKTLTLPPDQAYGERRDDMVFQVSRDVMPKDYTPSVGDTLQMRTKQGMPMNVTVASVEEDKVLLDANHSLAGKELTFKVTLVEVLD